MMKMLSTNIQKKLEQRARHIQTLEDKLATLRQQRVNATNAAAKALADDDIDASVKFEMALMSADHEMASTQKVLETLTATPPVSLELVENEWAEHCRQMLKDFGPVQKRTDKAIQQLKDALVEYEQEYNKLRAEQTAWGAQIEASGLVRKAADGRPPVRLFNPRLPGQIIRPADLDLPQ